MDPFKPYQPQPKIVIPKMSTEDAETIALRAVAFIAADETLAARFVALTGCRIEEVRDRLSEPSFLGSVLDFILGDDRTAIAFAQNIAVPPEALMMARAKLP